MNGKNARRAKQNWRIDGFEIECLGRQTTEVFSRAKLEEATLVLLIFEACRNRRLFPRNSRKRVECDSAPAQARSRCAIRILNPHMHKDLVIAFETANLPQRHVIREADKTRYAITAASQRARRRAWRNQKEWQSKHHDQNQQAR